MEASFSAFDYEESIERIDEILAGADASYEDSNGVPARNSLTFTNGFYVDVTVLFVDIRGSKALSQTHTRPVLAKIYRAFISETVAVIRGAATISEIYIEGDGVWAVFNTTKKPDVDGVFEVAGRISSLVDVLNVKLAKKGYATFDVGIGIDDGETLYIKAGYKGAGINEVVWIGRIVGQAATLCKNGNRSSFDGELMVSKVVYSNLNEKYQGFLSWSAERECYHGNIVNVVMNNWVNNAK